jgi:hypothetical protein
LAACGNTQAAWFLMGDGRGGVCVCVGCAWASPSMPRVCAPRLSPRPHQAVWCAHSSRHFAHGWAAWWAACLGVGVKAVEALDHASEAHHAAADSGLGDGGNARTHHCLGGRWRLSDSHRAGHEGHAATDLPLTVHYV